MNLTNFTEGKVFFDSGVSCIQGPLSGQGIMVLQPKSKNVQAVVRLEYWFEAELESLDVVTYLLVMEGKFGDPDNWPPTEADPVATLSFNYWELAAENKWAQRQDCAGGSADYPDPDGSWIVSVTREP